MAAYDSELIGLLTRLRSKVSDDSVRYWLDPDHATLVTVSRGASTERMLQVLEEDRWLPLDPPEQLLPDEQEAPRG